jgi:hypothetical protein
MRSLFDSLGTSSGLSAFARVLAACVITATLFGAVAVGLTSTDEQRAMASLQGDQHQDRHQQYQDDVVLA